MCYLAVVFASFSCGFLVTVLIECPASNLGRIYEKWLVKKMKSRVTLPRVEEERIPLIESCV
jgi:hypothetical protein